ncbi:MAG: glycosyltransferase family 4 protein [Reinekea sp.]
MEYYAKDTALWLSLLGCKVTLLTTALPPNTPTQDYTSDTLKIVSLAQCPGGKYSSAWWSASKAFYLKHQASFDAVISVSSAGRSIAMLKERCPVIMQCHGTAKGEVIAKWKSGSIKNWLKSAKNIKDMLIDYFAYRHYNHFIAVGDQVYTDLINRGLSIPSKAVTLIRNGVERNPHTHITNPSGTKRVLSLSRLHQQKGIQFAIEAFKHKALSNTELHIAGTGPYETQLKKLASNAKNIHFLGQIERSHIPKLLSEYDAFIFTSTHREGYPLNLLEAMAAGLPVITSKHLADKLPSSPGVYPVPPRSTEEVAQKIEQALIGPHSVLPDQFYLEHVMNQYKVICEQLCQNL